MSYIIYLNKNIQNIIFGDHLTVLDVWNNTEELFLQKLKLTTSHLWSGPD